MRKGRQGQPLIWNTPDQCLIEGAAMQSPPRDHPGRQTAGQLEATWATGPSALWGHATGRSQHQHHLEHAAQLVNVIGAGEPGAAQQQLCDSSEQRVSRER